MTPQVCWAVPQDVTRLEECHFYHTMDLPGIGLVRGEWDLRRNVHQYLGDVDFRGKRVLEIGTASGFLCFSMERAGAEVVAFDLAEDQDWDFVPYAGTNHRQKAHEFRAHIRRLHNGYWLAHRAHGSRARVVYGTAYAVPETIGEVDVVTFGSILTHLRDPFQALASAAGLAREAIIVTDLASNRRWSLEPLLERLGQPLIRFLPDARTRHHTLAWWQFTPRVIEAFLGVLGFGSTRVTRHTQQYEGHALKCFTVVGRRE